MEKTTDATRRWSGPITLAKSAHTGPILRAGRALKCLYLVTRSLDPTGVGRARWMMRWKPALKASPITIGDPDSRQPKPSHENAGNTVSEIVPIFHPAETSGRCQSNRQVGGSAK